MPATLPVAGPSASVFSGPLTWGRVTKTKGQKTPSGQQALPGAPEQASDKWPGGCILGCQPQGPQFKGMQAGSSKATPKGRPETISDLAPECPFLGRGTTRKQAPLSSETLSTHCQSTSQGGCKERCQHSSRPCRAGSLHRSRAPQPEP